MPRTGITLPHRFKQFLERETVCSLAVTLSTGEVHIAPVLYWCDPATLEVYMSTAVSTEKMEWYRTGKRITQASIAIGQNKGLPYLLQMRGTIGIVGYDDTKPTHAAFMKVAHKLDDPRDADNTMILFRPTWARYSDWKNSTQEVIAL